MKNFIHLLLCDFRRMIVSRKYILSIAGLTLCYFFNISAELSTAKDVYYLYALAEFGSLSALYLLFAALPSATQYCQEKQSGFIKFSSIRTTRKKYICSKFITNFFSSFGIVLISDLLLIALLHTRYDLLNTEAVSIYPGEIYQELITPDAVMGYFMLKILCKGLNAAFFASLALFVSSLIVNRFVVLTVPVIAFYTTVNIARYLPAHLQIPLLSQMSVEIGHNMALTVVYTILFYVVAVLALMILFYTVLMRKNEYG